MILICPGNVMDMENRLQLSYCKHKLCYNTSSKQQLRSFYRSTRMSWPPGQN